jgi:NADP-dependent 3-hydroxy acid dehydrogenase YdfG
VPKLSARFSTALVTGASGGLGGAFAEMLLAEGIAVWGTSRHENRLSNLVGQKNFFPVTLDLADRLSLETALASAAEAAGGAFDLVVNNAGFGLFGRFDEVSSLQWRQQLEATLLGSVQVAHFAARSLFARNHGSLVNVSSVAVDYPLPFMSGYNIAKAGLSALSESLIFESRGRNVTVIDFRPGDYCTQFNHAMHLNSTAVAPSADARLPRAWKILEVNLAAAPLPERAARDLRAALLRGRSGICYSGGFFQTRLAPLFSRLAPASLRRAIAARYFGAV